MIKDNFNRIVDALEVKYVLASKREVIVPVELRNTIEQKDVIIQVNSGYFSVGQRYEQIPEDTFYLIPRGSTIYFRHGKSEHEVIGEDGFTSPEQREKYLKPINPFTTVNKSKDVFTILGFEVLIHGAIPFFSIMEIPCLMMGKNEVLNDLLQKIMNEEFHDNVGKNSIIKKYTEEIIIHICRYLYDKNEMVGNIEKLDYLLDKRLISIIQYIQENLHEDLSNHQIAQLAFVSKDYIGQFFKSLTNNNLQDYIENRRLDHAHFLLRSSTDSIQEIAQKVGFKDPAYFSRRFKIKFNQNAREVRTSDLMSI